MLMFIVGVMLGLPGKYEVFVGILLAFSCGWARAGLRLKLGVSSVGVKDSLVISTISSIIFLIIPAAIIFVVPDYRELGLEWGCVVLILYFLTHLFFTFLLIKLLPISLCLARRR